MIEFKIDEDEVRKEITIELARRCVQHIWDDYEGTNLDYSQREKFLREKRQKILDKIDWSKASTLLTETVVKSFFQKMLNDENKNRV